MISNRSPQNYSFVKNHYISNAKNLLAEKFDRFRNENIGKFDFHIIAFFHHLLFQKL